MIQAHPAASYSKKLNFWEEFPSFKVHKIFGEFWASNKKAKNLENSSLFMWALSLCYDRGSAIFTQPEQDKWEVVSEDLFGDKISLDSLHEDLHTYKTLLFPKMATLRFMISKFEESIDVPLGLSLRRLESKLIDRTDFMMGSKYSFDSYETNEAGKQYTKKGTADQLDKMFIGTDKIVTLINKALADLSALDGLESTAKGGEQESLGDGDSGF